MRIARIAIMALLAWTGVALADTYPSRPITFVVPSSAGGGLDVLSRSLAQQMGKQMGQSIVVDNRPGAVGMLGANVVSKAKPDGYTVLVTHSAPLLNAPFLYAKLPYDVRKDFVYVSEVTTSTLLVAANAAVPAKDMKSFLAWAAKNKGVISYGSYGVGSLGHLMGAYMSQSRSLDMTHVAYKGEAPMVQGLVGGEVQWAIGTIGSLAPHIASGRVRPLAVLGDKRAEALPNVPTMGEAGLADREYEPFGWVGMLVPAGTPPEVSARLEKEARIAIRSSALKERLDMLGMEAVGSTGEAFRSKFEREAPLIGRRVKDSGATLD